MPLSRGTVKSKRWRGLLWRPVCGTVHNEKRMLKALRSRPTDVWGLDEVLAACNWDDQAHAAGAGLSLAENGLVHIESTKTTIWSLGPEGAAALENGLLEQRIWDWLDGQSGDARGMKDLQSSEHFHQW